MTELSSIPDSARRFSPRQRLLAIVALVVVIGLVAWLFYWFLYARFFESTDDAYVAGDVIAVTAREPGIVLSVHADNTQDVARGQLLVQFDPLRAEVNLQAAEADLGQTVRAVKALFAHEAQSQSQLAQARVQLVQAEADYRRRLAATGDGAVSAEDVAHARDALASAKAALGASQGSLAETRAQIQGTRVENNPQVLAAEARLRDAAIALVYMRLCAPTSGEVAQRSVEAGEQVAAGTPLMAVVPLDDVWIDANFKETQLRRMRIGQPVTLTTDIYGGSFTYHGHVAGLAAGSGNAFALLPPQNATGNWIKIVQRVPVRIELDRGELRKQPLRVGLSVDATVDVSDESGPLLSRVVRRPVPEDTAAATDIANVDGLIRKIVAENVNSDGP